MFKPVSPQVNFSQIEERWIASWKKNKIFEKSVDERPAGETWTFLDGPPFITGMPHYGSLLPSILKDIFPRYWTMKGFRVRRVWGWDCHGLPVENKVEQKLGLTRKRDIEEKVGVKKFIDECKSYVKQVSGEWEWYIDHIARWVDFKNAYRTMDRDYMETVMWVFKQMYEKGFIYKGLRVSLYCPRCSTPISNFEVAMDADNYREVSEPSHTYKYELVGDENTYVLAWSTTPWNKLVTPALAVNPKLTYIKVKQNDEIYILAKSAVKILKPDPYEVIEELAGSRLVRRQFKPHYDFYMIDPGKRAFVIVGGDFVTAEEGTGIVTIAAYGEEDLAVMQKENIQVVLHVDDEGRLKPFVPKWAGEFYLDVNEKVNSNLASRGLLYSEATHLHTVPTCWRCHTRLYYAPQNAWYVDVQKLKPEMERTNERVNWYPEHFKRGRFLKSMQAAPDWCISRSRYWGSPVPVWECACGERYVPGSISELEAWSGVKISDLHKPDIDEVFVKCRKCGRSARRVPEVLDSWIEAGSASFAERHFPFEKGIKLEDFFPPDFVVEYTGQIRAWFYVLHVISTALYGSQAFKNVAVTGVILGTDGRKMSKNFGNYPDPREMIQKHGGDALRIYLAGNPVTRGEDMRISESDYRNQVRGFLLTLWNVYVFFVTYANVDGFSINPGLKGGEDSPNVLDKWVSALGKQLVISVTRALENYDTASAVASVKEYVDELSTWYVRRSRERVGFTTNDGDDKTAFYSTCGTALVRLTLLLAPVAPFVAEEMFVNLTGGESVHLCDWPESNSLTKDEVRLIDDMKLVRKVVEQGLAARKTAVVKVRQPLAKAVVVSPKTLSADLLGLIGDELNVKKVDLTAGKSLAVTLDTKLTAQLIAEGELRQLIRDVQEMRKARGAGLTQKIRLAVPKEPKGSLMEQLKKRTLALEVVKGRELQIELL